MLFPDCRSNWRKTTESKTLYNLFYCPFILIAQNYGMTSVTSLRETKKIYQKLHQKNKIKTEKIRKNHTVKNLNLMLDEAEQKHILTMF